MTVRIVELNMAFQLGGDPALLADACHGADVLKVQEARTGGDDPQPIVLADHLPEGWVSLQDVSSVDRAGSAIAYRASTVGVRWHDLRVGARPFMFGRRVRMNTRWIARAGLTDLADQAPFRAISCHFPLPKWHPLQLVMRANLVRAMGRARHVTVGLDGNQRMRRLGRAVGLAYWGPGRGVTALLTRGMHVTDRWAKPVPGSDHLLITIHADVKGHRR